jgi:hypothetical protein
MKNELFLSGPDCQSINFNHSPDVSDQNQIKVVGPTLRTYGGGGGGVIVS